MEKPRHYPELIGASAIALELIMGAVVTPIIDDIRNQHHALREDITERIEKAEAEIQGIRVEMYENFETHDQHHQDIKTLTRQINQLENRLYELRK